MSNKADLKIMQNDNSSYEFPKLALSFLGPPGPLPFGSTHLRMETQNINPPVFLRDEAVE